MDATIKALFIDLDGTLLTSQQEISEHSFDTLARCKARGIKIFLATGRSPRSVNGLAQGEKLLSLIDGGVYCNGGVLKWEKQEVITYMPADIAQESAKIVSKYKDINIAVHLTEPEKWAFRILLTDHAFKQWGTPREEALVLDTLDKNLQSIKVMVFHGNAIITDLNQRPKLNNKLVVELEQACQGKAQVYLCDNGTIITITAHGLTKNSGIESIRGALGIEKNELAVFGDDSNDVAIMTDYAHSFAMGNATCECRNAAKHVTLDNDNDGVAHAITTMLGLV